MVAFFFNIALILGLLRSEKNIILLFFSMKSRRTTILLETFSPLENASLPLQVLVRSLGLDLHLLSKEVSLPPILAEIVDGPAVWLSSR